MDELYKVMLVEKNKQMVHIYKNMIPWEEYGFSIYSVTDMESKAIAYYGEYKYDVIFTDIDLSTGNGISLIKKLKRISPDCIVVVIASQDDYDTVRDAFLAGAYNYLLKSRIRYSSLASLLLDIKKVLDERKHNIQPYTWEIILEKILGLIRDNQQVDLQYLEKILQNSEFSILQNKFQMLYFRQDNIKNFNRSLRQYDKPDWMNSSEFIDMFKNRLDLRDKLQNQLNEMITEIIKDLPNAKIIFTKKHSGLILIESQSQEKNLVLAKKLIKSINNKFRYDFSITISDEGKGIEEFVSLYKDVLSYHNHKFYDGDNSIEDMKSLKKFNRLPEKILSYGDTIIQGVSEQDFIKTEKGYKEALQYMKKNMIQPDDVKKYFVNILQQIDDMLVKKGIKDRYPIQFLIEGVVETESVAYLSMELEKMFKTLIDWNKEHHIGKYHEKVNMMINYILHHLDEKITLEQVSKIANLSTTHASRMFKNDVGYSIIDFINSKKMQKAESLMHITNKKIKDIAIEVGIQDQLYFNKVFKKYYHVSPREYKKKIL